MSVKTHVSTLPEQLIVSVIKPRVNIEGFKARKQEVKGRQKAGWQSHHAVFFILFLCVDRREQMLANLEGDLVRSWSSVTEEFAK